MAERLACPHFDTDTYYWLPSDPPFQHKRPVPERRAMLEPDLARPGGWVLSGSLCGWGDVFIPRFELVVFLWVPPAIRLARLAARERERYGAEAIATGGRLHAEYSAFMTWAAVYDDGDLDVRSRRLHEQWLAALPCPVLQFTEAQPVETQVEEVVRHLAER